MSRNIPVIQKPVPTREERLGSFAAYGGTCAGASGQIKCRCFKGLDRSFSQASVCQEWYSMFTLLTVRNSATIVHGPVGCVSSATCMNIFNRLGQQARGESPIQDARWFSTNLTETEAIHGGEAKLRETVLEVQKRYHPEVIFIFSSCVSGVIGDSVGSIVKNLQKEIRTPLLLSQCEGFRTSVWATGFDSAFHAVGNVLLRKGSHQIKGLVNVISPLTVGRLDELELERILSAVGLKANFIPCYSTIEDLRRSVQAVVTTATCLTFGDYLARHLQEKYGVPYTREVMPLGLEATDRWLREIAKITGNHRKVENFIRAEHRRIAPRLGELREKLHGKRVYVSAGQARAMSFSVLAKELGFELVGTTVYHYDEVISASIHRLGKLFPDAILNIANLQPYETANLIGRLNPDLYLADEITTTWVAKQGIPTMMIYDYGSNYLGYNGVIAIGEKMLMALANPGFVKKLSQHNPLPYKKSWYAQNPFRFIVDSAGV
ncbi:MAG: nitrogenase component 1 [Fibrobacteraceae bacterium]